MKKGIAPLLLCASGALVFTQSVRAQFAVIDVGAITQIVKEIGELQRMLSVAQNTLSQAQQAYQAITGGRGFQLLLASTNRNYLPATWAELMQASTGGGGLYGGLGSDVNSTIGRNAILPPSNLAAMTSTEVEFVQARRSAVALNEALTRQELQNVSSRFQAIQTLINAIPSAVDEKGILDLAARIQAEQGMLENENSKLHVLYTAAESQAKTARARADEQAILDIGHLNALPPMGL